MESESNLLINRTAKLKNIFQMNLNITIVDLIPFYQKEGGKEIQIRFWKKKKVKYERNIKGKFIINLVKCTIKINVM